MRTLPELAAALHRQRTAQSLSQQEMRMLTGMSQQQYQRIEAGQDMKVSTLLRVLAGLNLELYIADAEGSARTLETEGVHQQDDFWMRQHKHLVD